MQSLFTRNSVIGIHLYCITAYYYKQCNLGFYLIRSGKQQLRASLDAVYSVL